MTLSPEQLRNLILSVGTQSRRRPLSPPEVAEYMEVMLESGTTLGQLAEICHLNGTSMITRFRRLLSLTPSVLDLVDWGQGTATISFSIASRLASLDADNQEKLARTILEHRFNSSDVQQIIKYMEIGGDSVEKAVERVLVARPRLVRRHVFIGAVTNENTIEKLSTLLQYERDDLFRNIIQRHVPESEEWSGKLGIRRFQLTGGERLARWLAELPEGFERSINSMLTSEVLKTG